MEGLGIIVAMVVCALTAFGALVWLMRRGMSGWALTVMSLLGSAFAILIYASGRPFGVHPALAMSLALLFVLPALLGGGGGALLGWMLRNRDDRRL